MSSQDYTVAVRLSLIENVSKGLLAMGAQFATLTKQADIFQARLAALKSQMVVGAKMVGFGAAIAAPLLLAANSAGKLQQQLMFVQKATHASNMEMDNFRSTVERAAGASGMTSIEVGTMAKTLATGFQLPLDQISKILPLFSQYAINQKMFKGTTPEKSIEQALQLAHLNGHTDYASIKKDLDLLTQLNYIMPGDISKVLQAQKYAQGTLGNIMGVSQRDTMVLIATLNRFGIQGTRAGSSLLSAISRSIPGVMWSGLLPGQSGASLAKMGLTDASGKPKFFKEGKFDVETWMNTLNTFVKNERATKDLATANAEIMKAFQYSMGTTGTRLAAVLSSDLGMHEFEELKKSLASMPELTEQTKSLQGLLSFQQIRFWKDLQNVFTEMGYSILPDLTGIISTFSDKLESLTALMHAHPIITSKIEEGLLILGGLSILGGSLMLLRAGFLGLLLPFQAFGAVLPIMGAGMAAISWPAALVVAGIAAVGVTLYEMYQHWDFLKAKMVEFGTFLQNSAPYRIVAEGIKLLNLEFNVFVGTIKYLGATLKNIITFWGAPQAVANGIKKGLGLAATGTEYATKNVINTLQFGGIPSKIAETIKPTKVLDYLFPPNNAIKTIYSVMVNHNSNAQNKSGVQNGQPIHIHVQTHLDGRKVGQSVATHIYGVATGMPNTSSQFDTNLSPMPSIANAIGIG